MNRPELYRKTVDVLFAAYFNDTLAHESCAACAVGNLVAAGMGIEVCRLKFPSDNTKFYWLTSKPLYNWSFGFMTTFGKQSVDYYVVMGDPGFKSEIEATGYPWRELAKIEHAFEMAPMGKSAEDWMFNGLVAVLEVLKELHGVEDDTPELARFIDHRNKRTICTTH